MTISKMTTLPEVNIELLFTQPQTIQQADTLEGFNILTPQQRTELLTDMFIYWITCHSEYAMTGMGR